MLSSLSLHKLKDLRANHCAEMQRKEISDNFFFISGRFEEMNDRLHRINQAIKEKKNGK